MNNKEKYEKRQQWFISKVGKKLFRTKSTCECPSCQSVYEIGIIPSDKQHAMYMHDMEYELDIKYFETIEERNQYEKTMDNFIKVLNTGNLNQ